MSHVRRLATHMVGLMCSLSPSFRADFEPNVPGGIFAQLWDTILILATDPHPSVAKLARIILFYIVQEVSRVHLPPGS